jgi:gluconokinase
MQPTPQPVKPPRFFIVMGVSGAGKTTVGQALAAALGWDFYDADHFHPPENIARMSGGIPLSDIDRHPWLVALHDLISACLAEDRPGVLACSALKKRYRQALYAGFKQVQLVYLRGDYGTILERISERIDHYMRPEMLRG